MNMSYYAFRHQRSINKTKQKRKQQNYKISLLTFLADFSVNVENDLSRRCNFPPNSQPSVK